MITITKSLDSSAITGEKRGSRMDGKEECKSNEGKCVGGKKCKNKDTITTIDCGGKKVCCVGKPYAIARFCSSEFWFPMTIFGIDETSLISSNVTLLTLSLSGIQQLIFCWLSWSFNTKKRNLVSFEYLVFEIGTGNTWALKAFQNIHIFRYIVRRTMLLFTSTSREA